MALHGPIPETVSASEEVVSVPLKRSSRASNAVSTSIWPTTSAPGETAATSAPSSVARPERFPVRGRMRWSAPASSRLERPAVSRACAIWREPSFTAKAPSSAAPFTRSPPSGHPRSAAATRSDSWRLPSVPHASRPASTSQGALFASRSSTRPSVTSTRRKRSRANQGCAARPTARAARFAAPVSVTITCGRTSSSCGRVPSGQSTETRCTASRVPGSSSVRAVAAACPFQSAISSCPSLSVPPVTCEPQDSSDTRAAARPAGECRNTSASATTMASANSRLTNVRTASRSRERRGRSGLGPLAGGGCSVGGLTSRS